MLKIMLKEPVGGMIKDGLSVRASNYLEVEGTAQEFIRNIGQDPNAAWVQGTSPAGEKVAIPITNIAFIIEVYPSGN